MPRAKREALPALPKGLNFEPVLYGVDLGGTKIEGVAIGRGDGALDIRTRLRLPTEAEKGYAHIVRQVVEVVRQVEAERGGRATSVGIGTPGVEDVETGLMRGCNTTSLNGQPLMKDLAEALGVPVAGANDANCFAVAEAVHGAARGCASVFGVIMGTGVGGGLVLDGKPIRGAQGIAGEWGHNVLDPEGEPCFCGKRGCVERVLSGPALEAYYRARTGRSLPLREIAQGDDADARATLEHLFTSFGRAIGVVVNIFDPDVIVVGGGVGNIGGLYTRGAEEARRWIFSPTPKVEIVPPLLGDSAGVVGAALLTA